MPRTFGRLQFTTVEKRDTPSMGIKVHVLNVNGGQNRLVPIRPQDAHMHNLSPLTSNVLASDPRTISAKSYTYLLKGNTDLRLLVTLLPSRGPAKTVALICRPDEAQGEVAVRVNGTRFVIASGPFRRMTPNQAGMCFPASYKMNTDMSAVDLARSNVQITGMTQTATPRTMTTVAEDGTETTVEVRRRPRRAGT